MYDFAIVFPSVLNGLTTGAVYALVALGLTLIYGVLHIINFAHGSLLMLALYGVFFLHAGLGVDPYLALPILVPAMFVVGYALQRGVIGKASHGKDENILLVTLGLSIIIENLALFFWKSDTRTIDTPYTFEVIEVAGAFLPLPKAVAFVGALVAATVLWLFMTRTDLGKAIRAVAKERQGARLVGINVDHVFAMSFGIGIACLGAAACLLLPTYYVSPQVGHGFVLIAFTIVVLGGMGTIFGPLLGAGVLHLLSEFSRELFGDAPGLNLVLYGVVLVVMVLFMPNGLFGFARTSARRVFGMKAGS